MDHYYAESSPEARAYLHTKENMYWDMTINASLIGLTAAYSALARYLSGEDLYIPPRNRAELQYILRRYSADVIHTLISQLRSPLEYGGYSKSRDIAAQSLTAVLRTDNNFDVLLALHQPPTEPVVHTDMEKLELDHSPTRRVRTV